MTSKIKVDNINKVSDDSNIIKKCGSAVTVGASGNTVAVAGNDIRSDSYKASDGGVIISQSGTTVTIASTPLLLIDAEFTVDEVYPVDASRSKLIIKSSESFVNNDKSNPTLFLKNLPSTPSSNSLCISGVKPGLA